MTNEEIIAILKAAILTTTGGQMSPVELNAFIDSTVEQSDFLTMCRVERDIVKTLNMDIIGVGTRLLITDVEGEAPADLKVVTIPRRALTPVSTVLPYDISFRFLEKNIEREGAEATINALFGLQFGNDIVDLAWNGDTDSADTFIKICNGYIDRAKADEDTHKDNFGVNDKLVEVFTAMLKAMPNKFRNRTNELRFFVSPNVELKYRDELGGRNTALGDAAVVSKLPLAAKGIEVKSIFAIPDTEICLTLTPNLAVGFGAEMRVGRQLQERKGIIEFTLRGSVDTNYVISDAMVLFTQV